LVTFQATQPKSAYRHLFMFHKVPAITLMETPRWASTSKHGIPSEHYPAALALGIAKVTGGPVPRFEKVEREEPADGKTSGNKSCGAVRVD
jgi:hypothetical protein